MRGFARRQVHRFEPSNPLDQGTRRLVQADDTDLGALATIAEDDLVHDVAANEARDITS